MTEPQFPDWVDPTLVVRNEAVRVVDLVEGIVPPILRGRAFVACRLVGPAVLLVAGRTVIAECGLPVEALWQLDAGRGYQGGIGIEDCVLHGCTFEGVGLAGDAVFIQRFADDVRKLS